MNGITLKSSTFCVFIVFKWTIQKYIAAMRAPGPYP